MATPAQTTSIEIKAVEGNQLSVKYTGLPNNLPNTYGNYLVVWRNQNTIPWNNPNPDGYVAISVDSSQGSQVFENITVGVNVSYVVGYAVGPKVSGANLTWANVCTTGFVPASGPSTYISPSLSNVTPDSDSVAVDFQLPDGCTPKTNGAWIGIWESGQASYTTAPKASNSINLDSSQGGAAINSKNLIRRGQTYTIALFTTGWKAGSGGTNVQTAMACTITFTT